MSRRTIEDMVESSQVENEVLPALKAPRKYKVLLINDDYTPMPFVVEVLQRFFHMVDSTAVSLMLQVHMEGRAVCGVYTRDVAETKVAWVNDYARLNEHPLLCAMEPE